MKASSEDLVRHIFVLMSEETVGTIQGFLVSCFHLELIGHIELESYRPTVKVTKDPEDGTQNIGMYRLSHRADRRYL